MRFLVLLLATFVVSVHTIAAGITPPVLVKKEAVKWEEPPPGVTAVLDTGTSTTFTLYIPKSFPETAKESVTLSMHFHGASWWMIQEHERRGATNPLLVANAPEGDEAYEPDVMKPGLFRRVLEMTTEKLKESGAPASTQITTIEISSFSGGYSGPRGLLRMAEFEPMISRLMLNDSLYVGDGPDSKPDNRKPRADGLEPFIAFARKAAAGERTFLFEHSSTPSLRSVGPKDCSRAILAALSIPIRELERNSLPAARTTTDFPLTWRADEGNAHFWCYLGENVAIHLSHLRNNADMWMALDGRDYSQIVPPPMQRRSIKKPEEAIPGDTLTFDLGTTYTLYIPPKYKVPKDGAVELTMHFHGAEWFAIQEHLRRGLDGPLVALYAGEGSSVYKRQFDDPARFGQVIDKVTGILTERGGPPETHVVSVNITSFSAGYGAVREIVKKSENVSIIKRIILADSLYGSLDEDALKEGRREVVPEHVEPWANFARLAMTGEKTFLITTSDIETPTYASTPEVARAVVKAIGLEPQPVEAGSIRAAEGEYPLQSTADSGSFHWWGYGGKDAVVHMTIARRIGECWAALDEIGDP